MSEAFRSILCPFMILVSIGIHVLVGAGARVLVRRRWCAGAVRCTKLAQSQGNKLQAESVLLSHEKITQSSQPSDDHSQGHLEASTKRTSTIQYHSHWANENEHSLFAQCSWSVLAWHFGLAPHGDPLFHQWELHSPPAITWVPQR